MAAAVWRSAWPVERLRQRAFFTFGMDVLLKLNLQVCMLAVIPPFF
jgi:lycopene beta-cyclase